MIAGEGSDILPKGVRQVGRFLQLELAFGTSPIQRQQRCILANARNSQHAITRWQSRGRRTAQRGYRCWRHPAVHKLNAVSKSSTGEAAAVHTCGEKQSRRPKSITTVQSAR